MIKNKEDLEYYLLQDKFVNGHINRNRPNLYADELWKFLIILRYHEYYANCHNTYKDRVMLSIYSKLHDYWGIRLGYEIPINTFGYGLKLNHYGPIIVHPNAKIGNFCDIHSGVNIGQNRSVDEVPTIGNNVWIGPGVKIFGKIQIADGVMIGANSVVNKSFTQPDTTIVGLPAKIIKNTGNPYKRVDYII